MHLPLRSYILLFLFFFFAGNLCLQAQTLLQRQGRLGNPVQPNITYDSQGRPIKKQTGNDSLQRRDRNADSITIFFHYYDSSKLHTLDSSINDFTTRFPFPYYYRNLGNHGTAAESYFFNPLMKAGFDPGFHQYDIYGFNLENTKIFQTTRPYTEMAYVLGSKAEQLISVTHTQNRKPNLNFSLEYRFSNAPGNLKNQNASENNFRFTTHYQTLNRKYESFFVFISNKAASSENGGLQDIKKLDSLALNDPYELETRLGKAGTLGRNPFNTTVNTGNIYKSTMFLYRHHFDIGSRDSLVTDSVTYQLFYPRLRIEHNLQLSSNSYQFLDNYVDTANYLKYFNYSPGNDSLSFKDSWQKISNEFSVISFPEKNNQSQFLKAGIALENIKGSFDSTVTAQTSTVSFYNLYALGEYRNRTRNQVWDIEARGQLYLNGFNAGDYAAYISMKRSLGKKLGYLNLGFQNVNRSPSFILNAQSAFPVSNRTNYGKENIIRFFAAYENPRNGWRLGGEYFAVTNYFYFDSFFTARQEATLFNILHLSAEKKFRLSRYWNWYTEVHVQQTTGQPPVHIPFLLTRNRIAFEGNFATNLFLSTGLEVKYYTAYKANNYSPFLGQFFVQDSQQFSNRPEIAAFMYFRIKSFKGFFRLENLNTLNPSGGFKFNHLNFMTPQNPTTGLWIRFGLWWSFVN